MVAPMRHHNSPEERAKREAAPEGDEPKNRKGFRHYNHPDEIAKREAAGEPPRAVVVPHAQPPQGGRVMATTPPADLEAWGPSLGEPNNEGPVRREVPVLSHTPERPQSPDKLDVEQRLEQLEHFVYALLDSPREAREFRMLLSNQGAVTESQRDLIGRVRALERTLDQVLEGDADTDAGDAGDEPVVDEPGDTDAGDELQRKACPELHPLMGAAAGVCGLLEGHAGVHTWQPPGDAQQPQREPGAVPPTEPTT